jgi:hypothetical protein
MFGRSNDGWRVATRYDRFPKAFLSAIALAAIVIYWLRVLTLAHVGIVRFEDGAIWEADSNSDAKQLEYFEFELELTATEYGKNPQGGLPSPERLHRRHGCRDPHTLPRPLHTRAPCPYLSVMARTLILAGIVLIVIGLLWGPLSRLGLGRLPGDIVVERENFTLYIPVTSAILVSVVLSVVVALIRSFLGR